MNILSTLSNGNSSKQKIPADGVHRIRVDFKVKVFCDGVACGASWTSNQKNDVIQGVDERGNSASSQGMRATRWQVGSGVRELWSVA